MLSNFLSYFFLVIAINHLSSDIVRIFMYSTLMFWIIFKNVKYYKNLPPGPWGIPLLGILPFLNRRPPHVVYVNMSKQYGDVFSVQMGSNLTVCIGSTMLMKEFFSRNDSTGRPHTPLNNLLGGLGVITSEGDLWKRQRQFLHEKFRALGVKLWPNTRFEKEIFVEIEELMAELDGSKGKAVNPTSLFGRHIHNVITQLMMSFRFTANDEAFTMFNERVSRGMRLFGLVLIGEHVKAYLKLPGKQVIINEIKRNLSDLSQFHRDHIVERMKERASLTIPKEPQDLLDHYLDKIEAEKKALDKNEKKNIFPGVQPENQIVQVMNDLFSAGMETSLSTLMWTFIMMLRNPEVADKARSELKKVVPPGEMVTMAHRLELPYIEAVLLETMRYVSIVPLGTTHVNTADWKIGKYIVPAGTHIIPLINKMNMDPDIYPEPELFKPERFIKGDKFTVTDTFMQFGIGQRMCIGNLLARMELFLFFSNVMHNFEFRMPEGEEIPPLEGILGATHAPVPFQLCFTRLQGTM
ncbi:cytochrome P450 18a1-like [Helicoverpa zea]|uniref:cytochrome P450 18a1-like n=1 Tax=Helicoverpa zea TaxID=7113 RepID=UPI001F56FAD0|nr:cytochrome P450 18a1-like [Helicoverpa zea]